MLQSCPRAVERSNAPKPGVVARRLIPDVCPRCAQVGDARSRGNEKQMPRENLERMAAELGTLDGDQLQVRRRLTP